MISIIMEHYVHFLQILNPEKKVLLKKERYYGLGNFRKKGAYCGFNT